MIDSIQWLNYACIRLQGPPLIYINPAKIAGSVFLADVILISDGDPPYASPSDVKKLCGPDTVIIGNTTVVEALRDREVTVLRPWQSINIDRARISAIPAYHPGDSVSPEQVGLGFLISLGFYDIYYAGETGIIPDMQRIRPDIAILPINNGLSLAQLVEAVEILNPRWVFPSHWEAPTGGGLFDMRSFQEAVGDLAEVVIPVVSSS